MERNKILEQSRTENFIGDEREKNILNMADKFGFLGGSLSFFILIIFSFFRKIYIIPAVFVYLGMFICNKFYPFYVKKNEFSITKKFFISILFLIFMIFYVVMGWTIFKYGK